MSPLEGAFTATSMLGPIGGMLGLAFAAGATAGWGFAIRTVLRVTKKQVEKLESAYAAERDECNRRIAALETRVREVEDRYTEGMERQLAQVRQSTVRILRDDDPI